MFPRRDCRDGPHWKSRRVQSRGREMLRIFPGRGARAKSRGARGPRALPRTISRSARGARPRSHSRRLAEAAGAEGAVLQKPRELTARRKDGTEFPIERTIVRLDARSPPIIMGFIRDLS